MASTLDPVIVTAAAAAVATPPPLASRAGDGRKSTNKHHCPSQLTGVACKISRICSINPLFPSLPFTSCHPRKSKRNQDQNETLAKTGAQQIQMHRCGILTSSLTLDQSIVDPLQYQVASLISRRAKLGPKRGSGENGSATDIDAQIW